MDGDRGGEVAARDVDEIRQRVECVEGDAHREYDAEHGKRGLATHGTQEQIDLFGKATRVIVDAAHFFTPETP